MKIIDYSCKYDEDIKDLLVELQTYIALIDKEKYNIVTPEYREAYFLKTMDEVNKYQGKILLAQEDNRIIGLIVGLINNDDINTYDFSAPKRGRVSELIVTKNSQHLGVGQKLLTQMEAYFKDNNCKGILIDVFAYNVNAQEFYMKNGYFNRSIEIMKKI